MTEASTSLEAIRHLAEDPETAELTRVLLNTTSPAEAALALQILKDHAPAKTLVAACNLREVLAALPATPFPIAVDADQLAKVGGFAREPQGVMVRGVCEGWELHVLVAGNLVLDFVIRHDGVSTYLCPVPRDTDFVTPGALDAVLGCPVLLDAILDTVRAMGLVFNPKFYLSLEDFGLEHAQSAMESLRDLF